MAGKKTGTGAVRKGKSKKSKKIKQILLIMVGLIFLGAVIYIGPKLIKVYRLKQEADAFVASSTVNTFKDSKTTVIYDSQGEQLCTMKQSKDLYYVDFSEIPETLADAFVVMEDKQFYEHGGIDIKGIIRAIVVNQQSNDIAQGASTITQQLARNIFLTQQVSWERKVEEIFIAVGLEKKFTKNQILEFYLNNIYFANGYYGVEAAAKGYFSKSVSELTLAEQAFIAAIPNSPNRYNPLTNYDNTVTRKNLILDKLNSEGKISNLDYYLAKDEEIVLNPEEVQEANNSAVTYARHCAVEALMSVSGFTFRSNFESQTESDNYDTSYETYYTMCQQKLLSGGYTVYTSIDTNLQAQLQASIDNTLKGYTALSDNGVYAMQAAATCVDNSTGDVVAIVGSRSQDTITGYTLNRAYQSSRQPGSAIKPLLVYTPFLQLGSNNPDTIVKDEAIDGGPANADGYYSGDITLRDAVKYSKNTVAWNILQQITPRSGMAFLTKMDFKNIWMDKDHIATSLGGFTYGVTTEEMAGAYATLANDGIYRKATCVVKILDASNKVIVDNTNRGIKVYEVNSCRMMTDMLKTVVSEGTGVSANIDNAIVAGKTGTTNSNKDAWFCGYSKYYTTAVWMGYDYPKEIQNPMANEIFRSYMQKIHNGLDVIDFTSYTLTKSQQQTTAAQETTQQTTEDATVIKETTVQETTTGQSDTLPLPSVVQTTAPVQNTTQQENTQNTSSSSVNVQTTAPVNSNQQQSNTQSSTSATRPTQATQPATIQTTTKATKSQIDVDAETRQDMDAVTGAGEW